jgi:microcystin-dependent protein
MAEPFLAEIKLFAGNFAPRGWAMCNGQILPISQNTALFSLLGTTYGGNGQTTFALPDFRGRAPVGPGTGPGLSTRSLGESAGTETVTLDVARMPAHTHVINNGTLAIAAVSTPGTKQSPDNAVFAAEAVGVTATYSAGTPDITMAANALSGAPGISPTGGGQPTSIMQPYLVVTYIIALTGIFPSRN